MVVSVFHLISLLSSEIVTDEVIVGNKMSSGFMLMLLVALWERKNWFEDWRVMRSHQDDEISALQSWPSWDQKLGYKCKHIVCHQCTWLPAVPTALNGDWTAAEAMQTAHGAVEDPSEQQPSLPMFPSFHSELLPLKWAVLTGPATTLGPSPGKWNAFILITPSTLVIWLCLQLSTLFDAIGKLTL